MWISKEIHDADEMKGMLQIEACEHGRFTEVGISGLHRLETEERDLFPIMARKQRDTTVACAEHGHHVECTFQHKSPALPMMKLGARLMDPRRRSQYPWLDRPQVDSAGQDIHFDPSLRGPRLNARATVMEDRNFPALGGPIRSLKREDEDGMLNTMGCAEAVIGRLQWEKVSTKLQENEEIRVLFQVVDKVGRRHLRSKFNAHHER
ncbi:hypothetical protein C8J57DRAFT_1221280 [Mycena rebaudengoi]|nr:hypothetical protein C8J57DRAFT_1221280 [Mycena rebaudengoi]